MPGLSFPPLLTEWKGASQGRTFPGGDHTRLKALEARQRAEEARAAARVEERRKRKEQAAKEAAKRKAGKPTK